MRLYFLDIRKNNVMQFYDPLMIESSLKERMRFMEKHKKRYFWWEIKGIFRGVVASNELNEVCHKYFRKYGEEYEIKMISGKV